MHAVGEVRRRCPTRSVDVVNFAVASVLARLHLRLNFRTECANERTQSDSLRVGIRGAHDAEKGEVQRSEGGAARALIVGALVDEDQIWLPVVARYASINPIESVLRFRHAAVTHDGQALASKADLAPLCA